MTNEQPTQGAFYMLSAEQLEQVAQAAADKVAAKYVARHNEVMLSPKQAAERLSVTSTTLWRWSKAGLLKPLTIGGKKVYKHSEVEAMVR